MRQSLLVGLAAVLSGSSGNAQTVAIDHRPVACAMVNRFPRLEARLSPEGSVGLARVVFQGANVAEWYSVDLKPAAGLYAALLPKPKSGLREFRYYIEVASTTLEASRTPEFTIAVVDSAGACRGGVMAASVASASVVVQAPVGAGAVPAGFASGGVASAAGAGSSSAASGVAATGGGMGATALVLGGLAAAGGAVAVVAGGKGSDGDSATGTASAPSTPTPTPAPTPAPTPGSEFAGRWSGAMQWLRTNAGGNDCNVTLDASFELTQSGTTVSGSLTAVTRSASPSGCDRAGQSGGGPVTGSASGATLTLRWDPLDQPVTFNLAGTLAGGIIMGTLTGAATDNVPERFTGTFSVSR